MVLHHLHFAQRYEVCFTGMVIDTIIVGHSKGVSGCIDREPFQLILNIATRRSQIFEEIMHLLLCNDW